MSQGWSLPDALGIGGPQALVALVGGGGKTSLLFALAAALPGRTVITTTTRIFAAQMALAPAVCSADDLTPLGDALDAHRRCLVIGPVLGEKAAGVDVAVPAQLLARPDVDYVLVEADGSRMRPVKAPAEHEPVVPPETTHLIPVAGIDALDRPLVEIAHRPERVRALLGPDHSAGHLITAGDYLTPEGLAALLAHPDGGLKATPGGAVVVPFINKVETADANEMARQTAWSLLERSPRIAQVALGAARTAQPVHEVWRRVGGVVLAAGESTRMGRNKLLLPWAGGTVVEQTVANARAAHLSEVVVVTGHEAAAVAALPGLTGLACRHNPDYEAGMLTSVQRAVRHAPDSWSAVLVILGDQPMVSPAIINQLLAAYAQSPAALVVPRHAGRRGNPVLIDRRYFADLLALPPGAAPRVLLARHPDDITWVDMPDDTILRDLDRPEDYARWRPSSDGQD